MGFWGIEVKPEKPYPYHADNVPGKLHVTQATLGLGSSTEKSILQCSAGHKNPVFLCSLLPNKTESCPLNLEFDEDDLVAFSVIGPRSIHLSGYFEADDGDELRDDYEYDSFGEDISDTETGGSSEYNTEDEYADGFIDDSDIDTYPPSPVPNSGVVIEELVDDDKPESGDNASKKSKKKVQMPNSKDSKNSQQQIVVRGDKGLPLMESEDEDGFPISASLKEEAKEQTHERTEKANKRKVKDDDHAATLKRKVEVAEKSEHLGGKKTKKKKLKEQGKGDSAKISGDYNETHDTSAGGDHPEEAKTTPSLDHVSHAEDECEGNVSNEKILGEKKMKKKKKKKTKDEGVTDANQTSTVTRNQDISTSERVEEEIDVKPSQIRTFPNGLVVEELSMGKPDGKRATAGKQVSVRYIGKLQKNGKIFDSNIGRAPFKFRLGIGQVIKGWDVGVNGMRIGDKRRITIPPSMGYGDKRAGSIPPNSWLVFDVELIDVR
ncbi:peptidyl-prolyl cis-trans isomerase FKBP53 [Prosopis cineraria]|uniref:peptidyl-prolyl cis-trans isomerase FKBP53 n=1 Tax=Prosopis cineraria TaxID=364024 RepID=UPI00240ECA76|nr:peptidyl-prolyl cis-trans isomerase FKBP53 [Prosopis cineraria]